VESIEQQLAKLFSRSDSQAIAPPELITSWRSIDQSRVARQLAGLEKFCSACGVTRPNIPDYDYVAPNSPESFTSAEKAIRGAFVNQCVKRATAVAPNILPDGVQGLPPFVAAAVEDVAQLAFTLLLAISTPR
jgi:hypothetical protein